MLEYFLTTIIIKAEINKKTNGAIEKQGKGAVSRQLSKDCLNSEMYLTPYTKARVKKETIAPISEPKSAT